MIDQLRQMAIFAKVIEQGSFRGAAQELKISPSVVSHHISDLEAHLGVALIYRSTRKLNLTPQGRRLFDVTKTMFDAAQDELETLSASADDPSGELRITLPSILSISPMTARLAAFSIAYPRVSLTLDFSDTRRALIEDGYDIAIRMGPKGPSNGKSRILGTVDRILVASDAYIAAKPPVDTPHDVEDWEWLAFVPAQAVPLTLRHTPSDQAVTLKPKPGITTNDAQAMYRLACAGAGVAIVPEFLAKQDIEAGRMHRLLPDWSVSSISIFAQWPANAPRKGLIHLALNSLGT